MDSESHPDQHPSTPEIKGKGDLPKAPIEWVLETKIEEKDKYRKILEQLLINYGWPAGDAYHTAFAFQEEIMNAIVHGNLQLFKKNTPEGKEFEDWIVEEQNRTDNPNNKRQVIVTIRELSKTRVVIDIQDQSGNEEEFWKEEKHDPRLEENLLKPTGRGEFYVTNFVNEINYEVARTGGEAIGTKRTLIRDLSRPLSAIKEKGKLNMSLEGIERPLEESLAKEVREKVWQREARARAVAETLFEENQDLEKEKQALEEEVVRDKTGLLNDKGFLRETAGRLKDGGKAAILFLDIDDFKNFNDKYGHGAADEALKAVAAQLRQRFRGTDVLCRWGGDEFVVCLFNTTADKVLSTFPDQEGIKVKFAEFSKRGSDVSKQLPPGLKISLSGGVDDLIVEEQRGVDVVEKIRSVIQNASLAKNAAKIAGKCHVLKYQKQMANPEPSP